MSTNSLGWGELWGIADRIDYDLKQHQSTRDKTWPIWIQKLTRDIPHCRAFSRRGPRDLAFLCDAYDEETVVDANGKETSVSCLFPSGLAPFKAAVLPLTKKLNETAIALHEELSKYFMVDIDLTGSIGKRYRRQDEIGTPFCITVDFDTEADQTVTIRDRDTMEQIRLPISDIRAYIEDKIQF